jgi:hypothetical protein
MASESGTVRRSTRALDARMRPPVAQGSMHARPRRSGLRAEVIGEEERHDTVATVASRNASRLDDALVGHPRHPTCQGEVATRRQLLRERCRALEVGEHDGPRAAARRSDFLLAIQMARVAHGPQRRERHHAERRLLHEHRSSQLAVRSTDPRGGDHHSRPAPGGAVAVVGVRDGRGPPGLGDPVDDVIESRIDECSQPIPTAGEIVDNPFTDLFETRACVVQGDRADGRRCEQRSPSGESSWTSRKPAAARNAAVE